MKCQILLGVNGLFIFLWVGLVEVAVGEGAVFYWRQKRETSCFM